MNDRGSTLIDSLFFFAVVILIVSYLCILTNTMQFIENSQINKDGQYEEAYE